MIAYHCAPGMHEFGPWRPAGADQPLLAGRYEWRACRVCRVTQTRAAVKPLTDAAKEVDSNP